VYNTTKQYLDALIKYVAYFYEIFYYSVQLEIR